MCTPSGPPPTPDWLVELIRQHLDRLYAFCRRLVWDEHRAEDLAGDVIVLVLRKWSNYDRGRPFWPWLWRLAVRRWQTECRRHRVGEQPFLEDADSDREGREPDALDDLVRREDRDRVRAAVDALPDHLRGVVLLRYADGLDCPDIADALGVPVGTVYRRLYDAKQRLAGDLGQLSGG